jgi:hypothetical protein
MSETKRTQTEGKDMPDDAQARPARNGDRRDDAPPAARPAAAPRANGDAHPPARADMVGRHLRAVYGEALQEDIPEQFLALLKKLDEKGSSSS